MHKIEEKKFHWKVIDLLFKDDKQIRLKKYFIEEWWCPKWRYAWLDITRRPLACNGSRTMTTNNCDENLNLKVANCVGGKRKKVSTLVFKLTGTFILLYTLFLIFSSPHIFMRPCNLLSSFCVWCCKFALISSLKLLHVQRQSIFYQNRALTLLKANCWFFVILNCFRLPSLEDIVTNTALLFLPSLCKLYISWKL